MENDRPSRTAELAAMARAAQANETDEIHGHDTVAVNLISPLMRFVVTTPPLRRFAQWASGSQMPGSQELVLARSLFGDQTLVKEIDAGTKQVVVLGAGYDTRGSRFAEQLKQHSVAFFEVDIASTQRRKREKLKSAGLDTTHIHYVEVDFNTETVVEKLQQAGYDQDLKTQFFWDGVSFYLDAKAISAVLLMVSTQAGPDSAIVFDYLWQSLIEGRCTEYGSAKANAFVARRGEPFTFGIDPEQLTSFLNKHGLDCVENLMARDMETRFLTRRDGSLKARVGGYYGLCLARQTAF